MKDHLTVCVIGDKGSGKSTLVGHLMVLLGIIPLSQLKELEKKTLEVGRGSAKFAWFLMTTNREREYNTSIQTRKRKIETTHKELTMIDTAGSNLKTTIRSLSQSDAALLVVSAEKQLNIDRAMCAISIGCKQLIVAVNRSDDLKQYQSVCAQLYRQLGKIGFINVVILPVDSMNGYNIISSQECGFQVNAPSLIDALDALTVPKRFAEKPFRMPIECSYRRSIVVGRIESGSIKANDKFWLINRDDCFHYQVVSIQIHNQTVEQATAGDHVGIKLRSCYANKRELSGVCSSDPLKWVAACIAQIIVIRGATIKLNSVHILFCNTQRSSCRFKYFYNTIDRKSQKVIDQEPTELKQGDCAIVEVDMLGPIVVEPFAANQAMGRFLLLNGSAVIVGVVKSCEYQHV